MAGVKLFVLLGVPLVSLGAHPLRLGLQILKEIVLHDLADLPLALSLVDLDARRTLTEIIFLADDLRDEVGPLKVTGGGGGNELNVTIHVRFSWHPRLIVYRTGI